MITAIEVAKYYLMTPFVFTTKDGQVFEDLVSTVTDSNEVFGFNNVDVYPWHDDFGDFKLKLKHVDDMKSNEKKDYYSLCKKVYRGTQFSTIVDTPESIHYLIKNGYDAFNLIEKKEAIKI